MQPGPTTVHTQPPHNGNHNDSQWAEKEAMTNKIRGGNIDAPTTTREVEVVKDVEYARMLATSTKKNKQKASTSTNKSYLTRMR